MADESFESSKHDPENRALEKLVVGTSEEFNELAYSAPGEHTNHRSRGAPGEVRILTETELAAEARERPASPESGEPTESNQQRLLRSWDSLGDTIAEVTITLAESNDAPRRPLSFSQGDLDAFRASREDSVAASQEAMARRIESVGGKVTAKHWLANQVVARVPAKHLRPILESDKSIVDWSGNSYDLIPDNYDVGALRPLAATASARFTDNGVTGCASSPCYRVAVLDPQRIARNHRAFARASNPTQSRVVLRYDCLSSISCSTATYAEPTTAQHQTQVAGVLAGSIEGGQDPAHTTTVERVRRSGVAPAVDIVSYVVGSCEGGSLALQSALSQGARVANASYHITDSNVPAVGVNASYNCGGLNAMIASYTQAGGTLVASADNAGAPSSPKTTSVGYPASRPEVVAVGGLDTDALPALIRTDLVVSKCAIPVLLASSSPDISGGGKRSISPMARRFAMVLEAIS